MTTLEKSTVTVATPEDLKVIQVIVCKMDMFDGYYGKYCKYKMGLIYKEYSTLRDDFKCLESSIVINRGKYSIREIGSLKRSLQLIRDRYVNAVHKPNDMFTNFLDDSILNLDKWINEIIEQIVSSID
jgi:hypothetical protein